MYLTSIFYLLNWIHSKSWFRNKKMDIIFYSPCFSWKCEIFPPVDQKPWGGRVKQWHRWNGDVIITKICNCINCHYHCDDHISISSVLSQFKSTSFNVSFLLQVTWVSGLSKGRGQGREDGKKGLTQTSLLDHVIHPDSGCCADWMIYNAPWRHTTRIKNFITAYSVNWSRRERKLR